MMTNTIHKTLSHQSGSYLPSDVTLLLDIVDRDSVNNVPVAQKEALIQTGKQHYSDMLTLEKAPTAAHEQMYQQALQQGKTRLATDINNLCATLAAIFSKTVSVEVPLILVSLVRAGLPIGVLLQRALSDSSAPYSLPSKHYGVSIIRDRGLDPVAFHKIRQLHPHSPIVFVDGWTGKGAIYGELVRSLAKNPVPSLEPDSESTDITNHNDGLARDNVFHQGHGVIPLLTLADPAGVAWLSASSDDWLIPSGLLGCTVSGLISRTLFNEASEDLSEGLHRSVIYEELQAYDRSLEFVETVDAARKKLILEEADMTLLSTYSAPRFTTQAIIENLAERYQVSNINRIKPTIAEATRAVMRRDPEKVLLASSNHPDTQLLRHLCQQKQVTVEVVGDDILPYQAVTIIKKRN